MESLETNYIKKDKNGKVLEAGQSVLVPDPNDTDIHNHEFEGTIENTGGAGNLILVVDMENNFYQIEAERLEIIE